LGALRVVLGAITIIIRQFIIITTGSDGHEKHAKKNPIDTQCILNVCSIARLWEFARRKQ
jgi:hypothetical protein